MADQQQSNIIQENNVARTGLNLDQSVNQIQKGQLSYALNAAVENYDSNSVNYQNEPGNELCLNFPEEFHIIGTHFINEQNKHIFFLTNPTTGASEIGYMDNNDCIYHTYISGTCLNFNIDNPIHKAVHKITNCATEIYWTDGLNPRRYLDLNNLPYKIKPGTNVCDNETIPELDCNKIKVQPNFNIPNLKITNVVNGGNLIAGTYQFAIQYCDVSGDAYTSYYSVTNPTPIFDTDITTPDYNYPVGRSIEVLISNIDVTGYFEYYNLAVIKTINAITSVELIGTYYIDDSNNTVTYNGQNQSQIRLTLNEIFEKFAYYEIAQDITSVQDVLVWDNLTSIDRINYQKIASQINLNWQTYKLPANENYSNELNATNLRGYLRDEVYAFEIVFLLRNGKQTDGFHIPGRVKNFNEYNYPDVPTTNPDFIGEPEYISGGIGYSPYWKIYNTGSTLGNASGDNIGNATPYEIGQFAYWESTDVYPCNVDVWGELANTPIRHHKFPDVNISPIFQSGTPTISNSGFYTNLVIENESVFPIGVRLSIQQVLQFIISSDLTQSQKEDILGFKIARGDRNTNSSIIGKGVLRNVGKYNREGTEYYFPNYPYNDLREDPFLLTTSNSLLPSPAPAKLDAYNNLESPYRYIFNSPETSFGKPFLGNILKIENVMYGGGRAHFVQVRKNAFYKFISENAQKKALDSSADIANIAPPFDATAMFTAYQAYLTIYINGITRKNYAYSYNSIAQYNYWANVDNGLGIKQRELDISQYIIPGVQNVGDLYNINNYNRESSVYLKTINTRDSSPVTALPYASKTQSIAPGGISLVSDESRYTISEKGNCLTPNNEFNISTVAYYGSIKNILTNQWGQMYSYNTIDTGFQTSLDQQAFLSGQPPEITVFGGDTFISKFSFKTKLPFFIDNRVGAPDDSDVFYDEIGNVAYPKYWHSSRSILSNYTVVATSTVMNNIISIKAINFDCASTPDDMYYDGNFYLFAYGIPTFYCESSVNVDLRQAFNNREGDFFPHVSTGIPDEWLQQTFVPIVQDNTYYYNPTFSKQNKENAFSHLPIDWTSELCFTNFPFRAIYSDRQQSFTDNRINSWLIYRPISFFDFPQNYGELVSLDGIQNRGVLARFENKSLLYNTLLTIDTSNPQAAYIGNDTLFRSAPPIDFAETDLGYVGSQNKMLLKIPQGQITIDAKRGQVFLISGNQVQDLSAFGSGLNRFFTDHLAFEILRYFSNVPVDNHFNGVGLHGVYDSKYDRIIISKLDYISNNSDIKYDEVTNEFYINKVYDLSIIRQVVYLTDVEYFCNKSWTLSFNFNTKSWISFHTYIPNWYIGENNFFYSGINDGCNLEAIAAEQVPTPSTTTTSTTVHPPEPLCQLIGIATRVAQCELDGNAERTQDCSLGGYANAITTTTTTTTPTPTTTTTTTLPLACECHDGTINNNNAFSYYDCNDVLITGGAELGSAICYDINKAHSGNITDNGPSITCSCTSPS